MAIYRLEQDTPEIAETAYVAESAVVVGKVKLEEHASVWFNVSIRGDNELIHIGENSNVQEGAVLHTDIGYPMQIGNNVTIGHLAMVHGDPVPLKTLDEFLNALRAAFLPPNSVDRARHDLARNRRHPRFRHGGDRQGA